jgi:hypothetical protein
MMPKTKHILKSSENICKQLGGAQEKGNIATSQYFFFALFWFVRFLFVLSKL